jgi:hypothetical protein
MSAQENRTKGAKIGKRELALAQKWHKHGLLSAEGLHVIECDIRVGGEGQD